MRKVQQADQQRSEAPTKFSHPVDAHYHGESAPLGVRVANAIIGFMGSWPFLIIQTILVGIWVALNVFAWVKHFDPYPFILLNLAFSTQAAYAAPMILMASNVAAAKDRELWENDYATNQKAYEKIEELERQIKAVAEQNQQLLKLMVEQKDRSDTTPELSQEPAKSPAPGATEDDPHLSAARSHATASTIG